MTEYFYNFKVNEENQGYSYLRLDHTSLFSLTRFRIGEDETYSNVFSLKLSGEKVLACKHGDADWVDFSRLPPNHYPGCAYPLLLSKVTSDPYTYIQVSEDDGSILGETVFSREGRDIVESQKGTETRRFTMRNGVPIKIDWGGAISILCETADEAIEGSGIEFENP